MDFRLTDSLTLAISAGDKQRIYSDDILCLYSLAKHNYVIFHGGEEVATSKNKQK